MQNTWLLYLLYKYRIMNKNFAKDNSKSEMQTLFIFSVVNFSLFLDNMGLFFVRVNEQKRREASLLLSLFLFKILNTVSESLS